MKDLKEVKKIFRDELLNYCVPFWLKNGVDKENGGIINCLDRQGKIYSDDKSVWMQGRCGYMYSYIYNNIEKKKEYLDFAKSCIDFSREYCIDSDGRMFFTVTKDGMPLRKRRYWFSESFYIIANAEYYKASKDEKYLQEARKYFDFIYEIYKNPSADPYKITPKSYAQTRDMKSLANPMIMLNVSSVMRECDTERAEYYSAVSGKLVDEIKNFHKEEFKATFENITVDNEVVLNSAPCRVINPGHDIECSWFLLNEAKVTCDDDLKKFAKTVFLEAFARGWDEEFGGITYFKDVLGLPVEAYEHDMKLWWPHNEATIASLMFYLETGEQKYLDIFDKVTDYEFEHFSDREYGEWYGYLRRDGKPTEPPCKGHTYKGPFHVMRMLSRCLVLLEKKGY